MIVKVVGDGASTDVPVTPDTTCSDVIECCRDPGDETCDLIAVCPEHGGKLWTVKKFSCVLRHSFLQQDSCLCCFYMMRRIILALHNTFLNQVLNLIFHYPLVSF
ncbi:hypothetical protein BDFB_008322 [Asbolus verrucosus]|uniref:Apoptosis-stimulating of p53 protein 2-like RA domain-containing protein n=1 Tax=Asbolus verrucosus TaxID=1661398 RepID=A0A482VL31_ASBVE|nr:hypothetical protein BDFB_008322 [Asbolus verrucosus]